MLSVSLALLFLVISTAALRNGETLPSYVSVRALDHYGNAIQLGHAKEASQRYGRSVVVAVVEVYEPKNSTKSAPSKRSEEGQHEPEETEGVMSSSSFLMVVSLGNSPVLHPVQLPLEAEDDDSSSLLAMCFTGVKGDANWLLQQIQKHSADVWERYNTRMMSVPVVAHIVARLLGRFAAQPEKQEWQSSLGLPGKHDRDDDKQSSWSRPLGVQTMILSLNSHSPQQPGLLIVEPSGRILIPAARSKSGQVSIAAMGKASDKIQERLLRLFRESERSVGGVTSSSVDRNDGQSSSSWEDLPPTYDRCQDALIRILLEETVQTNNDERSSQHHTGGDIMVESYSKNGEKIERRIFRYQNANTFAPIY
jgi:hypothetical protein